MVTVKHFTRIFHLDFSQQIMSDVTTWNVGQWVKRDWCDTRTSNCWLVVKRACNSSKEQEKHRVVCFTKSEIVKQTTQCFSSSLLQL